jgi:hypothetical protein
LLLPGHKGSHGLELWTRPPVSHITLRLMALALQQVDPGLPSQQTGVGHEEAELKAYAPPIQKKNTWSLFSIPWIPSLSSCPPEPQINLNIP